MKKLNKLVILILLLIFSCKSNHDSFRLKMSIIPFGGGEKGYSIIIDGNVLEMSECKLDLKNNKLVLGAKKKHETKILSNDEINYLKKMIKSVSNSIKIKDSNIPLDTWVITVSVDGLIIIKMASNNLFSPLVNSYEKRIINYLLDKSPEKINFDTGS